MLAPSFIAIKRRDDEGHEGQGEPENQQTFLDPRHNGRFRQRDFRLEAGSYLQIICAGTALLTLVIHISVRAP